MPMHNLIEYNDIFSEKNGSLWQYCGDKPVLDYAGAIIHFPAANINSVLFNFKEKNNRSEKQRRHIRC